MMFQKVGRSSKTEAFGLEYIDALYGYALMLTRNRSDAEDLVQETYVRALDAKDRLREDSNVKGWFFTILRNLWLNQLRKRKSEPHLVEIDGQEGGADYLSGNTPSSDEILVAKEDVEQVRFAIRQLSPEFQEVIHLREFEELSYQQIAIVLSCPTGTVMSRLGRARAKLRALLTPTWSQPASSGKDSRS
jgi:RNA polymerase sigma-70 factor (ECF subfamily)